MDCGNLDATYALRKKAADAAAPESTLVQLDIRLATCNDDAATAMSLAKEACAQKLSLNLPTLLTLGECAIDHGMIEDAALFADIALGYGCDLVRLHRIKYTSLILLAADDTLEGELRKHMFAEGNSENHSVCLPLLAKIRPGDPDRLRQLVMDAAARWPTSAHVKLVTNQLKTTDDEHPQDPATHLETIKLQLAYTEQRHPSLIGLQTAFSKLRASDLSRPMLSKFDSSGVSVTKNSGTGDVMVFFKGLGVDVTKIDAIDAYASAAGLSVIYLNDPKRLLFCDGVSALGNDLDTTLKALQNLIDDFGPRRNLTMASMSAGGIGALLYGLRLKADRILCYSPPTFVHRNYLEAHQDKRARAVIYRLEKHIPVKVRDIAAQLDATTHCPQIDVVYAAEHQGDRGQAEYLHGKPGVSLYPIAGYDGHPTIQHAMKGGYLIDNFRGDMSSVPV